MPSAPNRYTDSEEKDLSGLPGPDRSKILEQETYTETSQSVLSAIRRIIARRLRRVGARYAIENQAHVFPARVHGHKFSGADGNRDGLCRRNLFESGSGEDSAFDFHQGVVHGPRLRLEPNGIKLFAVGRYEELIGATYLRGVFRKAVEHEGPRSPLVGVVCVLGAEGGMGAGVRLVVQRPHALAFQPLHVGDFTHLLFDLRMRETGSKKECSKQ